MERCGVPPLPERADARCSHLRRGWYWGARAFEERLRRVLDRSKRPRVSRNYRSASKVKSHGLRQAQAWLQAGLEQAKLT